MIHKKMIALALSVALICSGLGTSAAAAVISTHDAAALANHQQRVADVEALLAREDVEVAMISLGVDPVQAQQRVASLSEQELVQLQGQLETLPAGGVLGLIGAVFVVLLLLEVTGVIDIFKKV